MGMPGKYCIVDRDEKACYIMGKISILYNRKKEVDISLEKHEFTVYSIVDNSRHEEERERLEWERKHERRNRKATGKGRELKVTWRW
jgi:hypothetical protein